MGNLLGKEKPLKEVLRENKRMINRAVRELDREKTGLEREEKRLTMEIKKAAKEGHMGPLKIMAKVSWVLGVRFERIWSNCWDKKKQSIGIMMLPAAALPYDAVV